MADHINKLDTAKEIVMLEHDSKSRQVSENFEGVEISTPSGQTQKGHIIKLDIAKGIIMSLVYKPYETGKGALIGYE